MDREHILLVLALLGGCFSPESSRLTTSDDGTGTGTDASTSVGSTMGPTTITTADTSTDSAMTSVTTTPSDTGTTDPSGTEESSGSATTGPTSRCSDGDFEPGELCFEDVEHIELGFPAVDVALGKVDDDQLLDLAVAAGGTIALRPGDGVGGFGNIEANPITGDAVAVGAGDFDGDGLGDMVALAQPLAMMNAWNAGWDFIERPGNGQFVDAYNDLVVADFDGGELDIVYTSAYAAVFQHGFVNGFSWDYSLPVALPLPGGEGAAGIAAAALVFDGDADLDVVVLNRYTNIADVLVGDWDGTFTLHSSVAVCPEASNGGRHVAIGDIDGDGYQDLVVTCETGQLAVTLANDDGTFAAPVAVPVADGFDLALANVDDDGEVDVVVASPAAGTISVMRDEGGSLTLGVALEVGEPIGGIAVGDVDNDGALDIVAAVPSGSVAFFRSAP